MALHEVGFSTLPTQAELHYQVNTSHAERKS